MVNNIKHLREKQGISQAELSRRLGFSRSYMNRLENNKQQPNMITAMRIAEILNCSLDEIFFKHNGIQ